MSLKERDRLAVLSRVMEDKITLVEASDRLGVSYRQAKRLWQRYREVGDAGLVHGLRGRSSNNRSQADDRRARAIELYRERYRGFGPTLAAEQLAARDGLAVDHETLRGWLIAAGLWTPGRRRRRVHRRRERRSCFGELVQLDGSDHLWFGEDYPRCVLMVLIDDATGWTWGRLVEAETVQAAMTVLREWVAGHGLPRSLYPDRHSIYRRNDKAAEEIAHRTGTRPLTRFGEAMEELNVGLICAHSPQAKGRVERANGTLQDRLVKLLALEGITTIEAANAYLEQTFLPDHNARFAVEATEPGDAHRPAPSEAELAAALCPVREGRVVDKSGCVSWRGRCFELAGSDAKPRRRRQVVVRQHLDGRVELVEGKTDRVLESRERAERPQAEESVQPSLAERVAAHAGPTKPTADHPWRRSFAGPGCAAAR